jgi:hypothetical protein
MTAQERTGEPAMAPSAYLSLRTAVRPAIYAHYLLAEDQDRAGQLAAECEDLLFLTRELLKAAGLAGLLGAEPAAAGRAGLAGFEAAGLAGFEAAGLAGFEAAGLAGLAGVEAADGDGGDRQARLLGAYAEAGMLWAKVVGSTMALARALLDRGDWDGVRRLAGFLADAGEDDVATELTTGLGRAVLAAHREQLKNISNTMPPAAIGAAVDALRAVLRDVPEDYPDRNRQVNHYLPPLAASVHAIMRAQEIAIPYSSRLEHIAAGGVARYPDIVKQSLDEIAAEFEGLCLPGATGGRQGPPARAAAGRAAGGRAAGGRRPGNE